MRLITFMTDDYPNSWSAEKEIQESVWYWLTVVFTPATGADPLLCLGNSKKGGVVEKDLKY